MIDDSDILDDVDDTAGRAEIILIMGVPGTGKTTLAAYLASDWPEDRVWVHDPMAQWTFGREIQEVERGDQKQDEILQPGNLLLLDEIDVVCPAVGWMPRWAREAIRRGRHHNVSLIGTVLRAKDCHGWLRKFATRVYIGYTPDPDDLAFYADCWGPDAWAAGDLDPARFEFIEIIRYYTP